MFELMMGITLECNLAWRWNKLWQWSWEGLVLRCGPHSRLMLMISYSLESSRRKIRTLKDKKWSVNSNKLIGVLQSCLQCNCHIQMDSNLICICKRYVHGDKIKLRTLHVHLYLLHKHIIIRAFCIYPLRFLGFVNSPYDFSISK